MQQPFVLAQQTTGTRLITSYGDGIRTEMVRKSLHALIAFVPSLTHVLGPYVTMYLLAAGTLSYTAAEMLRLHGTQVPFVSRVTVLASRTHGRKGFELGPVTLGLGAMLALYLYPAPAAAIAVYALAFGDGFAGLGGKLLGLTPMPELEGKTLEGSTFCYIAVFLSAFAVTGSPVTAVLVAAVATTIEAFPLRDLDNIVLPLGTGLIATVLPPL
ncbi:MAG: phosphatidate cytidylyltransferase [Spirochaetaceae bacterium]